MKFSFLKTLCLALAAAVSAPANAVVPFPVIRGAVSLTKPAAEAANALPGLVTAAKGINIMTTGADAAANVKRVEAALKPQEMYNMSAGFNRTIPNKNPQNFVQLRYPEQILDNNDPDLRDTHYKILVSGNSYAVPAKELSVMRRYFDELVQSFNLRGSRLAFITNPVGRKDSVFDITKEAAVQGHITVKYIASDHDVKYFGRSAVAADGAPKYILPTDQACSEAGSLASNILLIPNGFDRAVVDFINAVKQSRHVIILDNPSAYMYWDGRTISNAAKYLSAQITAFRAGKPLPYAETAGLDRKFLEQNRRAITDRVLIINPWAPRAGKDAALSNFLNLPE